MKRRDVDYHGGVLTENGRRVYFKVVHGVMCGYDRSGLIEKIEGKDIMKVGIVTTDSHSFALLTSRGIRLMKCFSEVDRDKWLVTFNTLRLDVLSSSDVDTWKLENVTENQGIEEVVNVKNNEEQAELVEYGRLLMDKEHQELLNMVDLLNDEEHWIGISDSDEVVDVNSIVEQRKTQRQNDWNHWKNLCSGDIICNDEEVSDNGNRIECNIDVIRDTSVRSVLEQAKDIAKDLLGEGDFDDLLLTEGFEDLKKDENVPINTNIVDSNECNFIDNEDTVESGVGDPVILCSEKMLNDPNLLKDNNESDTKTNDLSDKDDEIEHQSNSSDDIVEEITYDDNTENDNAQDDLNEKDDSSINKNKDYGSEESLTESEEMNLDGNKDHEKSNNSNGEDNDDDGNGDDDELSLDFSISDEEVNTDKQQIQEMNLLDFLGAKNEDDLIDDNDIDDKSDIDEQYRGLDFETICKKIEQEASSDDFNDDILKDLSEETVEEFNEDYSEGSGEFMIVEED
ncbi:Ring-infected erythrocyte surface antigen [Entamoeba marina]